MLDTLLPRKTLLALIALLLLFNGWLAYSAVQFHRRSEDFILRFQETSTKLSAADSQRRAFMQLVKSISLDSGFLSGIDVRRHAAVVYDSPRDGIYYVIDTECGACALNIPALNGLATQSHVAVIGLSISDNIGNLSEYVSNTEIAFPVIGNPRGKLTAVVPRNGTPISIIIHDEQVVSYIFGRLEEKVVDDLMFLARAGG